MYTWFSEWQMHIDLPAATVVGPRLKIQHGHGLVVNKQTVIGSDVVLLHNVTIGLARFDTPACPVIGNRVLIGAGSHVLGDVTVGDEAVIGAGCIVSRDVAPGEVVTRRTERGPR